MQSTLRRIWRRLDSFLAVNVSPQPAELAVFSSEEDLKAWRVFSDAAFGGKSQAALRWEGEDQVKHAVFEGRYNKALSEDTELVRSGYVGISTILPRAVDLSMHEDLVFRIRAHSAHTYMASLRTEQFSAANGEEAWQGPVTPTSVGEWEDVRIPLQSFHFTFRGRMYSQGDRIMSRRERTHVMGLGLTLAATEDMPQWGDFRLDIAGVTAVQGVLSEAAAAAKAQHLELSPEEEAQAEWEHRTLAAAKQLPSPGARREH